MKAINTKTKMVEKGDRFYTFYEGAIRGVEVRDIILTLEYKNLGYNYNITILCNVCGFGHVSFGKDHKFFNTIEELRENKNSLYTQEFKPSYTAFTRIVSAYSPIKFDLGERPISYFWNECRAEKSKFNRYKKITLNMFTNQVTWELDMSTPMKYYLSKEECEMDNDVDVYDFEDTPKAKISDYDLAAIKVGIIPLEMIRIHMGEEEFNALISSIANTI